MEEKIGSIGKRLPVLTLTMHLFLQNSKERNRIHKSLYHNIYLYSILEEKKKPINNCSTQNPKLEQKILCIQSEVSEGPAIVTLFSSYTFYKFITIYK